MITKKDKTTNKDLLTEYFQFQSLYAMQKVCLKHKMHKKIKKK